jgi:WD40 repeat protein
VDGKELHEWKFESMYQYVCSISVLDTERFLVAVSTPANQSNYRLHMFSYANDFISMEWAEEMDGEGYLTRAVLSTDAKHALLTSMSSPLVELIDIQNRCKIKSFKRDKSNLSKCAFLKDEKFIVAGDGKAVVVWNKDTGKVVSKLKGHTENVLGIVVHPHNPQQFLSFSQDATFNLFKCTL